ncbi:NAD/NADP-dependent betaine aldehyde dehydrogenase [Allorhodopirellula solitaria]|uniref:NAD/NADP-dependent betaine aldehyde dehydrogenase n=2 Tax=Allorhodopirellula solitaria TaxID=2527987 RepID=A0A5C5X0B6_9BACT|nr:NAD/NADP-dependent betaine aldehyde dehydrogenase [Allorhodopirellula solitaria]
MRSNRARCRLIGAARHEVAAAADRLVAASRNEQRREDVETVASELIPLCDALGWIARRGPKVLADRRVGLSGRPLWLWGVGSRVERLPWGRVLILGTWNYPVFLSGVQLAQALAGGNTVLLKPARGSEAVSEELVNAFYRAGVPTDALQLLDSSTEAAKNAIDDGVELVVLTGAAKTGQAVLHQTADSLTPTIMELSGVDAVVVLPAADPERLVNAIGFGLLFNSGATCIGPRRVMYLRGRNLPDEDLKRPAEPTWLGELTEKLQSCPPMIVHPAAREAVADAVASALAAGGVDRIGRFDESEVRRSGRMHPVVLADVPRDHAILQTDLFAPVMTLMEMDSRDEMIAEVNDCPYRLAASVFGPRHEAEQVAAELRVGSVTINDLVAPTADPRLPFGGRGSSGFGVTRGPEGLLAMTTPRVISTRSGRLAPHLVSRRDSDAELLTGVMQWDHGGNFRARIAGLRRLASAVGKRRRVK